MSHVPPVVVVTGATSGIGRATALAFAARGASVGLLGRRAGVLDEVAIRCRDSGGEALALPADVTDAAAVEDAAARVVDRFGRIDVWVNNAAVVAYGRVEEAPVEVWHRVVHTNLLGAYHGARAAIPWFREQGRGVLISVSSLLGRTGSPYQSAYVASKHAVRALDDCVRQEVRDVAGIAVCTILPGPVDTPVFRVGGNVTGWRAVPPGRTVDARRVAATIVRCAERPRREVGVGLTTRLALLGQRISPWLTERVTARVVERSHFADQPVAPTAGNVFEPAPGWAVVDGGWRDSSGPRGRGRGRVGSAPFPSRKELRR